MGILIGHARSSENNTISGELGDQSGKEVMLDEWYDGNWDVLIICKDSVIAEKAAQEMELACKNNSIGYDQYERKTAYESALNNGNTMKNASGEADCSQLIATCYILAGVTEISPDCYTGNICENFSKTNMFEMHTEKRYISSDSYAQRGAMYLKKGKHIIMALENGKKARGQELTDDSFRVGDRVSIKCAVTYDGQIFKVYYEVYEVMQVKGERVVIGVDNKVTCAINACNLVKINQESKENYVVQKGDSLWGIAQNVLGDGKKYIEIKKINNLDSDVICPGQILILPNKVTN